MNEGARALQIKRARTGQPERQSTLLVCPVAVDPLAARPVYQRLLGTTYTDTAAALSGTRPGGGFELSRQLQTEMDLGQVGYLIRTVDRTASRFVAGLVRTCEEFPSPSTVDMQSPDTNDMLLASALQITGSGKYDTHKAMFKVPFEQGTGTGLFQIMDTMHTAFMQETRWIFSSAEEQGLFYIRGVEDVAERGRIEAMLRGGNFTRVQESIPGTDEQREQIIGILPQGHPNAGDTVRAEVWPISEVQAEMDTDRRFVTTDGLSHSVLVSRKSLVQPESASPVGWIATIDDSTGQARLADQKTTVQLFALEHERRRGYKTLPEPEIEQLVELGMGNTLVPLPDPIRPGCPVINLVEPSDNSLVNVTITWVTLSGILRELSDNLGYDPSKTYLDTFARMRSSFQRRHANTVLTAHLAGQMLEALYPDVPDSYPDIQANFTSGEEMRPHFERILNNAALPEEARPIWYYIANFFQLEHTDGEPVSTSEGRLDHPVLDADGRVASTLLSIGVIALEQSLIAGLIPGSLRYGMNSVFGENLQNMADSINDPDFVPDVQATAVRMLQEDPSVRFGRQRRDSQQLLELVRERTGLATIIDIIRSGDYERFRHDPIAQEALMNMSRMGQVIQESELASSTQRMGRGINAGLDVIINNYLAPVVLENSYE